MLGPGLRDFDGPVAPIDGLLPHAVDLVAEDERILHPRRGAKLIEHHGPLDLLHGVDRISFGTQLRNAPDGRSAITPGHGHLGPQSRFVDVTAGRSGGDAAQDDPLHGESVARAEKGPDVLGRTNVVQHHRDRHLFHRGELLGRRPAEFFVGDFAHNGFGTIDFGGKSK